MNNFFDKYDSETMAELDAAYSEATVSEGKYTNLPDGKYQARIYEVGFREPRDGEGFDTFFMVLEVIDGEYKGRRVTKRTQLCETRMVYLKEDMAVLGIQFDRVYELGDEKTLNSMLDQILEIQIKNKPSATTGKVYMNIYLNRRVGELNRFGEVDMAETPWGK